jgi:plasmid stabilization system protein ParE
LRVEFTGPARDQVRAASAWWFENRPRAPTLFDDELAAAVALLESGPLLAQVWGQIDGHPVRKARLPGSRYALYFTVQGDLVTVHAVWHGARGTAPVLR